MVYFDNAATGGFKPRSVTDSTETVMRYLCANPGRSGHRLSTMGAEIVYNCRSLLANCFGGVDERVIFTKNCTEALNLAIFGTLKKGKHIITTVFEHNSVLRPLNYLKERGYISLDIVSPCKEKSLSTLIEEKINDNTYLIITTAISNVNGEILPIREIGKVAKKHNIFYLVDGAQGGGHIDLNLKDNNISLLALAGHKGLYGIMGSGVLLFNKDIDVEPIIFGGTGTQSFSLNQPQNYPEKLESGTLNLPAISALFEGVKYSYKNIGNFANNLISYTNSLIENLCKIKNIKVYSSKNPAGIVAFEIIDKPSSIVADILNSKYDIAVRSGFHCAPLMHKFLGTNENGLIRVSLSVQNSSREIFYFLQAINEISKN